MMNEAEMENIDGTIGHNITVEDTLTVNLSRTITFEEPSLIHDDPIDAESFVVTEIIYVKQNFPIS